jgi:hypothetical protein
MATPAIPAEYPAPDEADAARRTGLAPSRRAPVWGQIVLGGFLIVMAMGLMYALIAIWPAVDLAAKTGKSTTISLFGISFEPTPDTVLLALVVVMSALGSFVHAATSFIDYVGNRRLATSWMWWYIMRVLVGAALALLFYFAVRGGFFGADTPTDQINPYGIAALAGLVGLFSKQATDKLREVFDTIFRTAEGYGDEARDDSIANPAPVVAGLEPPIVSAGSAQVELTLRGEGFVPDSVVRISRPTQGGAVLQRETKFVDATELVVRLAAEDVEQAGLLDVTVFNPPPGGGWSGPVHLEVGEPVVEE